MGNGKEEKAILKRKLLNEMLRDEKKAPRDYKKLLKGSTYKERKVIWGIIKQEQSHYKKLNRIKHQLK